MFRIRPLLVVIAVTLPGVLPIYANDEDHDHGHMRDVSRLGKVQFSISCTAATQQEFDLDLALFYSFWYPESIDAFVMLTRKEPTCAMTYWGEAISRLRNPLAEPTTPADLKDGWASVQKAKSLSAPTERERDYITAAEAFYRDPDKQDQRARALAFEKAMANVHQRYPKDSEAGVLYALALNMTAEPNDKTYANQLKAAEILETIFTEQPDHPGVAHLLIHSYDYPDIADRGLAAARKYAAIAPAAPHALHMPAHIFTRLGYWQDSIQTNRNSAAVANKEIVATHPGAIAAQALHAYDYMVYAYMQGAQDAAAKRVVDEINAAQKVDIVRLAAPFAFSAIPARYAIERERWDEAAALSLHPADFSWKAFPQAEAILYFARGLGAARKADVPAARSAIERLSSLQQDLATKKQNYWVEQTGIQIRIVSAWTALAEGNKDEALASMRSAADREDATEKHIVTPGSFAPARELLGEMLLALGRPELALKEFEASQKSDPNRFKGLYGAAKASELSGHLAKARSYYEKLVSVCEQADSERPQLTEAKAFLSKN
jgi:tetratricopeptide (TPR) repeat protein